MIGMIALAGIIVRNSILLVDFIQLAEARGRSLREAVIEAGSVRFRPIALTAAAVVIGGLVMVLDPIFQGLAVALMSGAIVATLLTMVVVPLLYWELMHRRAGEPDEALAPDIQRADARSASRRCLRPTMRPATRSLRMRVARGGPGASRGRAPGRGRRRSS